MKKHSRLIKCRWCQWSAPLLQTINGEKRSGWKQLWEHARYKHPTKIAAVRRWIKGQDTGRT